MADKRPEHMAPVLVKSPRTGAVYKWIWKQFPAAWKVTDTTLRRWLWKPDTSTHL